MPADSSSEPGAALPLPTAQQPGPGARTGVAMLVLFLLVSLLAVAGGVAYYRQEADEVFSGSGHELNTVSSLKLLQLAQWRRERLGDADVLRRADAASSMERYLGPNPDAESEQTLRARLGVYLTAYNQYDRVFLVDTGGNIRLASPNAAETPGPALLALAAEAMATGGNHLGDFYRDERDGLPHIGLVVPVEAYPGAGRPIGAVILRIDPTTFLYPLLDPVPGNDSTLESELVRRDGDDILFLSRLPLDPAAALSRRMPVAQPDRIVVKAAIGETGIVQGLDYSGTEVLGFLSPVPDTPWFLVVHVEVAALEARLEHQLWLGSIGVVLLIISAGSGLGLYRFDRRARAYRTQAEVGLALRESEERLRLAVQSANQGLWDLDLDTGNTVTTPEYATMLGYDASDFHETSASFNARLHPDDYERSQTIFQDYVAGRRPDYNLEFRQRARHGAWIWIHSVGRIMAWSRDGRPLRMLGIHTDITARKQAEMAAERMSRLYATLSRCDEAIVRSSSADELFPHICKAAVDEGGFAMAWVGLVDPTTSIVGVAASYGTDLAYLDGLDISVDPDSPRSYGPVGTAIRENRPVWVEDYQRSEHARPWLDRWRQFGWVGVAAIPLRRSGLPIGAFIIYSHSVGGFDPDTRALLMEMGADISFALDGFAREEQRADAELRLKETERRYRTIFENSPLPTLFIDEDNGNIHDANRAAARFYQWTVEQLRQMNMSDVDTLQPDELHRVMRRRIRAGADILHTRHRLASGDVREVDAFISRVTVGGLPFDLAIMVDVTARYRAEEALRVKDRAIESSINAVGIADLQGHVTYVNRAFLDLWEYKTIDDVLGHSVTSLWEDPAAAGAIQQHVTQGGSWIGEMRALTSRRNTRELLVSASLVTDEQGHPICLAGAFVDITERKHAEESMQTSLIEKEALLKEVHHRVKNNLQVISSLLRLELGRSSEPGVKTVLNEMQNRILSMALLHETLYRSADLAHVDLSLYVTRLVSQLFRSSAPSTGRVVPRVIVDPATVDLDQAMPCGLLVTELVSNSLKHAFPDNRAGEVHVELSLVGGGPALRLVVRDSGIGLPDNFDERRTQSLGLQLVADLVRQLHGTLTVDRGPGACFTLVFTPRNAAGVQNGMTAS